MRWAIDIVPYVQSLGLHRVLNWSTKCWLFLSFLNASLQARQLANPGKWSPSGTPPKGIYKLKFDGINYADLMEGYTPDILDTEFEELLNILHRRDQSWVGGKHLLGYSSWTSGTFSYLGSLHMAWRS